MLQLLATLVFLAMIHHPIPQQSFTFSETGVGACLRLNNPYCEATAYIPFPAPQQLIDKAFEALNVHECIEGAYCCWHYREKLPKSDCKANIPLIEQPLPEKIETPKTDKSA